MAMQPINTFQQSLIDSADAAAQPPPRKEMGKEDFLKLLVTQLRHQDPLNPMDSVEFTAQLAQFSSLEQMFRMNSALSSIRNSLANQEEDKLLDYIGKAVKTDDNRITLKDGQSEAGLYTLHDDADVTIFVRDADGILVRKVEAGWKDAGEYPFQWDGRNDSGLGLNDGMHTFEIQAVDENGYAVSSHSFTNGTVSGVTYESDIPYLIVGDKWISPEDIISITQVDQPI